MRRPVTLLLATGGIGALAHTQITTREPHSQLRSQVSQLAASGPNLEERIDQSFVNYPYTAQHHAVNVAPYGPMYQSMRSHLQQLISPDLAAFAASKRPAIFSVAPTSSFKAAQPSPTRHNASTTTWPQYPHPADWVAFMTACRAPMSLPRHPSPKERMNYSMSCFMEACDSFASLQVTTTTETFASLIGHNAAGHPTNVAYVTRTYTMGFPSIRPFAEIDGCRGEQNCSKWCQNYARQNVPDIQGLRDFYIELAVILGTLGVLSLFLFLLAQCCNKRRLPWAGSPKEVEELSRLPEEKTATAPMPKRRAENASGAELDENLPNRRVVITEPGPTPTYNDAIATKVVPVPPSTATNEVVPAVDTVSATEVVPISNTETSANVVPVPNAKASNNVGSAANPEIATKVVPVPASKGV